MNALFLVALDMIRAQRLTQEEPGEVTEGMTKQDVAITPLARPSRPSTMLTALVTPTIQSTVIG